MKGLTFYICFGRYGGFGYNKDGNSFRITLGWVSFCVMLLDIEVMLHKLVVVAQEVKDAINAENAKYSSLLENQKGEYHV